MSSRLLGITAALSLVLAFAAGCGGTPAPVAAPATPTAAVLASSFPVTTKDAADRTVNIKAKPQRIVSLSPSITEDLFAIGAGDQVVGVTKYCNYPAEATKREQIGGYTPNTMSLEKIVALKPDLVVAESRVHAEVIPTLEQLGLTVYAINASTMDDVYTSLRALGQITGHSDDAAFVVTDMQTRIKLVTDKIASVAKDKRPTVFWEIWDEPLMTAGPATFPGQLVDMAGGVSIFNDVASDYPQISAEEIIKRDPSVIMGPDTHGDKLTTAQIVKRPGWETIKAAKQGRVYLINGDTSSRPGPRLALALEDVAKALHPDLFKQ